MQNCLENVTKPRENLKTTTRLPCRKTAKLIEKNCSKTCPKILAKILEKLRKYCQKL